MIITSLAAAEASGRVESIAAMRRYWLVDDSDAQGLGAVSLDVLPVPNSHRFAAGAGESAAVVVEGRERGRVWRVRDHGSSLVESAGEPTMLLTLHSRGVPTAAADDLDRLDTLNPFDPLVPGWVDDVADSPAHNPALGFFHMQARMLVEGDSRGRRTFTLGLGTFAAGEGCHALHRHANAAEVFFIWEGAGVHLTGDGAEHPLRAGELVLVPPGEWHGFRTAADSDTRAFFGYLGVDSRSGAGYEVRHP